MELRDYLRVATMHWIGIVVLTALGLGASIAYTSTLAETYQADSSGLVRVGEATDATTASVNDALAKSRAASYVDLATSRAVADRVIDNLGLDADAGGLASQITVVQPVGTVTIRITATAGSPQAAQDLANGWVVALAEEVESIESVEGRGNNNRPTSLVTIEPVEAAVLPGAPSSPNKQRNYLAGGAAGLILGLMYAGARSRLDRRLRSPDDVEREFGVPIAGRLPVAKTADTKMEISEEFDEQWDVGEAFRTLRTNLAYMGVDDPPRVVVVTSPRPKDGKSTVAANLAAAIALSGQPVTLVDGDLRRPTVATKLGLVEGSGLTDVLIGRASLDDVLQERRPFAGMSVLAAGSLPPNPSELLGSHAMGAVLKDLAVRGMVIIDAPPLLPVTDGAVLTRQADGALMVVSFGATVDQELQEALGHLRRVHGKVLGVVFNKMPRKRGASGYGYQDYTYYTTKRTRAKRRESSRRRGQRGRGAAHNRSKT